MAFYFTESHKSRPYAAISSPSSVGKCKCPPFPPSPCFAHLLQPVCHRTPSAAKLRAELRSCKYKAGKKHVGAENNKKPVNYSNKIGNSALQQEGSCWQIIIYLFIYAGNRQGQKEVSCSPQKLLADFLYLAHNRFGVNELTLQVEIWEGRRLCSSNTRSLEQMLGSNIANCFVSRLRSAGIIRTGYCALTDFTIAVLQFYKWCVNSHGQFPAFLVFMHVFSVPSCLEGNTSLPHVGEC